jgi:hypothetical protein
MPAPGPLHGFEEEIEMSQRNRIALAALALATLSLLAPSASHAAGFQAWRIPAIDALDRAWTWVAHLLPGSSYRTVALQEKEGGAVNPDGGTPSHLAAPIPPAIPWGDNGPK